MRKILFLLSFVFLFIQGWSQVGDFVLVKKGSSKQDKIKANVEFGSQLSTSFNNDFLFSNYINPSVSYRISKKFMIVGGVGFANTQVSNSHISIGNPDSHSANSSFNTLFAYGSGLYKLSNRLVLSANYEIQENLSNYSSPIGISQQLRTGSFGVHYKVNSFLSIDAKVGVSNNPYSGNFSSSSTFSHFGGPNSLTNSPFF